MLNNRSDVAFYAEVTLGTPDGQSSRPAEFMAAYDRVTHRSANGEDEYMLLVQGPQHTMPAQPVGITVPQIARLASTDMDLFENRHIRHTDKETGESLYRKPIVSDVIGVCKNLQKYPMYQTWPGPKLARQYVMDVQKRLDIYLLKH